MICIQLRSYWWIWFMSTGMCGKHLRHKQKKRERELFFPQRMSSIFFYNIVIYVLRTAGLYFVQTTLKTQSQDQCLNLCDESVCIVLCPLPRKAARKRSHKKLSISTRPCPLLGSLVQSSNICPSAPSITFKLLLHNFFSSTEARVASHHV